MATKSYWQRFQRQRISRRRMLAVTGAGAAGLAVVAACGDDDGGGGDGTPEPTQGVVGEPKYGNRYQIGTAVNVDTLDPHISIAGGPAYFPRIYNVLVARSALDAEFEFNDLAESFEQPDETTWIFSIRPGVKIAPNDMGVPERDMDGIDAFESFERIKGLDQANAAVFVNQWFAQHEANADGTVYTVNTPDPYAWFILRMGFFINNIPPRELIQNEPERMRTAGVGGGPFLVPLGGYTEGERLVLNKNTNYYRTDPNNDDAQLPYIDGMDVRIIADRSALRTAFLSEQTHSYAAENKAEADELLGQYDVYQGSADPTFTFIAVTMNVLKPPFDDPRVRKAVMHSINRQQYIDIVYKGDAQANGIVHWPTGAYALDPAELDELQKFDPELSKQLLTDAGHDLPLKIKVMFPANSTIEEHSTHLPIFLEQMAAAGFEVEQDAQDFATWLNNYTEKNYDMSLALNQIYETPEIPLDFYHSAGPAGDQIYSEGMQDPAIDAQIDAAKIITDSEELVSAIQDLQRTLYEAGPMFLPIVSPFNRTLYWNFVKNIPGGVGSAGLLLNDWWLDL
ncbi:MAG: ABC transporter substrate-binding protein [Dehalococcoidia bacterium]